MTAAQNYRILVIDDNRAIHEDFRKILTAAAAPAAELVAVEDAIFGEAAAAATATAPTYDIDSAYQGEEGLALVRQSLQDGRPYAVAFVDMRMPPGWDGLQTIKEIWKVDPKLNIVISTAFSDHSWAEIEAVGDASDRLLVLKKPFEPIEVRRLAATLTAKWTLSHQAAMKMAELQELVDARTKQLSIAATHDRLTGLPNRMLFHERVTQALAASKRQGGRELAVLFLDFDRFKYINDSLGHEAGDQLLKGISARLTSALRETDTVSLSTGLTARLGGDEFCILLTGLRDSGDAAKVAQRMLDALAAPYDIAGCKIQSTASIGIALSSSGYTTADEMIRDADTAMYRAKADGKARFVLFDAAMHEAAVRRLTVESDLRHALERGEMEVFFQPFVSVETARPTGAEALIRWRHPERGMLTPCDFIAIAEESGTIHEIGQFVLNCAATHLKKWSDAYPSVNLSMSVNVTTRQLAKPDFISNLEGIIARTGCDPARLILEITESALVGRHVEATGQVLRRLQQLGVRIFLDDFGTGCSSLGLLHTFNLNGLKIDRTFIHQATERRALAAIIHAVTDFAHNINMEVVAEGIEAKEQLVLLQCLNCETAQGFLFSQPLPAEEFEQAILAADPDFTLRTFPASQSDDVAECSADA